MDRIRADENFAKVNLDRQVDPLEFVGRSREQVDEFCSAIIDPIEASLGKTGDSDESTELRVLKFVNFRSRP